MTGAPHPHAGARGAVVAAAIALLSLGVWTDARAEGRLRIATQFGIVYLLLDVAREQRFIERQGTARGVAIDVELVRLSGGAGVNEALLSGSIDVSGAGVGPLLTIWDRTRGRQNVRGVASLGNFPLYLVSIDPRVKTIADFGPRDRIAMPAVGVSMQSRILQLASARQWGYERYGRLDRLQVAVPHPDATAAMIGGATEITAHFASPPFQEQILAGNPRARVVLKSYDVLGGPASVTLLYATEKFRRDNPKTYQALVAGLADAAQFVRANPERAADIFIRANRSSVDRALLLKIIRSPEVEFTIAPRNTFVLAEFMHRVGAIRNRPASARDYLFDDAHSARAN